METKKMYEKIDIAIDAIKIARTALVGIELIAIDEVKEELEKVNKTLLTEWFWLKTNFKDELLE